MLNEKRLYLIVSDYPYGNGEPFLEDELNALSKNFGKITLIITNPINLQDLTHKFSVPDNIELKFYIPKKSFSNKLKALFSYNNLLDAINEIRIIRKEYKLRLSYDILKHLFSYIINSHLFFEYLKDITNSDNTNKASNFFYTYWCTFYTLSLVRLKREYPSIKTCTRVHRWDLYMNVHAPAYLPFRNLILKKTDKIFSVSKDGSNYLQNLVPSIDASKIKVNYLGTTINKTPQLKQRGNNKITILSLAFISKVKRVDLLAEAISTISDLEVEWHHIGGGGDEALYVEGLAEKLLRKKKNIQYTFHGNQTKSEIYSFLDSCSPDILINTSSSEGLPVSIMEAMSFGIPVLATNVGGTSEIVINDHNGLLLTSNPSKEEIALAIQKIASLSDEEYFSLSHNAYKTWNENFNNELNNQKFIDEILRLETETYRICSRCIIDNIDYPEIVFDEHGTCNICNTYDQLYKTTVLSGESGQLYLEKYLETIKKRGAKNEYDCIIGISGGVDSTYLAYMAKQWGLRPLLVHVDNGWNTELAVSNIENIVKKLGFDLHTTVINWTEIKDLQLAYLKASVIDIDIPTDNTFVAALYDVAKNKNIKYIVSGHNLVTEGWMPQSFSYDKYDTINLRSIHKKFGTIKLKTFPTISKFQLFIYQKIFGINSFSPLNYIDYNKENVKKVITNELGWRDYGGKHYENIFTRFYQGYILPEKFGFDKRKFHLSALICSGQLSKEQALSEVKKEKYPTTIFESDREFFLKKLGLSNTEFEIIIKEPIKSHLDYSSYNTLANYIRPTYRFVKKILTKKKSTS